MLAGIEVERLIIGETLPNTGHDLEEAAAIARLLCRSPASINAYLEFARTEAAALLGAHAASVRSITSALVEHRTIYTEQIDNIIRRVRDNGQL